MAFGEEAITAERNVGVGYGTPPVRQDYTGYEKEAESGLEFAQARYQNPVHGRFTSVDPLTASATIRNPQTFNRYTYALNSPYKFTDPLGLLSQYTSGACGGGCPNGEQSLFASGGSMTGGGTESPFEKEFAAMQESRAVENSPAVRATSGDRVRISTRTTHYTVKGKTAKEAALDAMKRAKERNRGESPGTDVGDTRLDSIDVEYRDGDVLEQYRLNPDTGAAEVYYTIQDAVVTAAIVTDLPSWTSDDPVEQARWDRAVNALKAHEDLHVADVSANVNGFYASIVGLAASGNGPSLDAARAIALQNLRSKVQEARNELVRRNNDSGRLRDANGANKIPIQ